MNSKVLFIIKTPPPITGATLMNKRVCNSQLIKNNINTKFLNISYSRNIRNLGNINIYKLYIYVLSILKLIFLLFKVKPNLVYFQISLINIAFIRDFLFVVIIKLSKTPILFHLRGKGIKYASKNPFIKSLYKFIFRNEDVICFSELVTDDIGTVFFGTPYILNNGIEDYSMKYGIKKNVNSTLKILFLSNLIKAKGILDFIDALKILNKKKYKFIGIIIGDQSNITFKEINQLIKKNDLENRLFLYGPKYDDEKFKLIRDSDIFVFPTHNEGFGNVVLEAMQFGLPIIATNEGSLPIIIEDNKNGFLIDKRAPEQIVEKLEMLFNNRDLVLNMGNASRNIYLEKFTLEKFEKNLLKILCTVLNKTLKKYKISSSL